MHTSRRTAGLGLLAYGIGTSVAFIAIGSPGGQYEEGAVTDYISSGHTWTAVALAYLGAFAALGLLPFASRMRTELRSGGNAFWGLSVAGTAAAVVGWFLVGGVAVAFGEGGSALSAVPLPVVYTLTEIANLVAVCSSAFFVGSAALVLAARAPLPTALKVATAVAGVGGILAGFFFPLFLFWLWALGFGVWMLASRTGAVQPVRAHQPA
jgi:hypothetical protein